MNTTKTPRAVGQTAHTPTPWHAESAPDSGIIFIRNHPSEVALAYIRKGAPDDFANAAFITTACNSHAAIVEALRNLLSVSGSMEEFMRNAIHDCHINADNREHYSRLFESAEQQARIALAKSTTP